MYQNLYTKLVPQNYVRQNFVHQMYTKTMYTKRIPKLCTPKLCTPSVNDQNSVHQTCPPRLSTKMYNRLYTKTVLPSVYHMLVHDSIDVHHACIHMHVHLCYRFLRRLYTMVVHHPSSLISILSLYIACVHHLYTPYMFAIITTLCILVRMYNLSVHQKTLRIRNHYHIIFPRRHSEIIFLEASMSRTSWT